jgi:hypothetical protein
MSEKKKTSDSYEVGYGRPPKDTQFKKGSSGNPKGRPRKALDFDDELLRESMAFVTINENGRPRRISKHELAIKQLLNQTIGGNIPAARIYFDRHQIASEKKAVREASQSSGPKKYDDVSSLTDEELMKLIADDLKDKEEETKK